MKNMKRVFRKHLESAPPPCLHGLHGNLSLLVCFLVQHLGLPECGGLKEGKDHSWAESMNIAIMSIFSGLQTIPRQEKQCHRRVSRCPPRWEGPEGSQEG